MKNEANQNTEMEQAGTEWLPGQDDVDNNNKSHTSRTKGQLTLALDKCI